MRVEGVRVVVGLLVRALIGGFIGVLLLVLHALVVLEIDLAGQIDHCGAVDLGDCLVERGLEALDVGDEGGALQSAGDLLARQVVVVGLLIGGRQAVFLLWFWRLRP